MQELPTTPFGIPYISFAVIVLTFFIYLNVLGKPNIEKQEKAVSSVNEQFSRKRLDLQGLKRIRKAPPRLSNAAVISVEELLNRSRKYGFTVELRPTAISLKISLEQLFLRNDDQIQARAEPLFDELANYIKGNSLNVSIKVESETNDESEQQNQDGLPLALSRSQSLFRFFTDREISGTQINSAALPDHSDSNGSPSELELIVGPALSTQLSMK